VYARGLPADVAALASGKPRFSLLEYSDGMQAPDLDCAALQQRFPQLTLLSKDFD
jgi:hypothetical protein